MNLTLSSLIPQNICTARSPSRWYRRPQLVAALPLLLELGSVSGKRSRVARVDDEEVSGQKKRKENMVHKEGVIVDLSLGKEGSEVRFSERWKEGNSERFSNLSCGDEDGNGYGSLAEADAVVTQLGVSGAADMKIKLVG
ncbi:hypothetical protein QYF36_016552 [Acer negundo]|nr:hypothetical protein QYF36_016552 [Acer negundo]